MPFYVSDWSGAEKCGGRRFPTLDVAEKAAQRAVKLSAARNTHGWVPYDVIEDGRHITRSIVYPNKIERR